MLNRFSFFIKPINILTPNGFIFNNINYITMNNILVTNSFFKMFVFQSFNTLSINNLNILIVLQVNLF